MNRDIVVPLAEAKNNLSKLVDDAAAGQIIMIAKHGRTLVRLVPVGKPYGQRIGAMKGKLVLPEDFDASLPDDMLDAFEGTENEVSRKPRHWWPLPHVSGAAFAF